MADEATATEDGGQRGAETDWRAKYEAMRKHSRDWESKARANQDAADELEKLRAAGQGEQERATARAEKAEAELAELRAQAQRQAAVADKANVPTEVVAMLNGSDEAELAGQVKRLMRLLPGYPTRTDDGGGRATARRTTADKFVATMEAAGF